MRKLSLTVSYDLRYCLGRPGRPDPARRVRAAALGPPFGQGDRAGNAGQPAGGVAASQGLEGGRPRGRSAGGKPPRLLRRSRRARRAARLARSVLGRGARGVPGGSGTWCERAEGEIRMTIAVRIAPVRKSLRVNAR